MISPPCFGAAFSDKRSRSQQKRDWNSAPVLETRGVTKVFARVVANKDISITNMAAGIMPQPITASEVISISKEKGPSLSSLLRGILRHGEA